MVFGILRESATIRKLIYRYLKNHEHERYFHRFCWLTVVQYIGHPPPFLGHFPTNSTIWKFENKKERVHLCFLNRLVGVEKPFVQFSTELDDLITSFVSSLPCASWHKY